MSVRQRTVTANGTKLFLGPSFSNAWAPPSVNKKRHSVGLAQRQLAPEFSSSSAMRTISLAMSSGDSTKSMQP